jgi:hypothetical protein
MIYTHTQTERERERERERHTHRKADMTGRQTQASKVTTRCVPEGTFQCDGRQRKGVGREREMRESGGNEEDFCITGSGARLKGFKGVRVFKGVRSFQRMFVFVTEVLQFVYSGITVDPTLTYDHHCTKVIQSIQMSWFQ